MPAQEFFLENKLRIWSNPPRIDELDNENMDDTSHMDIDQDNNKIKQEETDTKLTEDDKKKITIERDIFDIEKGDIPFISLGNPILALITFLSAQVNHTIAEYVANKLKEIIKNENDDAEKPFYTNPDYIIETYIKVLKMAKQKAEEISQQKEEEMSVLAEQAVKLTLDKINMKVDKLHNIKEAERAKVKNKKKKFLLKK